MSESKSIFIRWALKVTGSSDPHSFKSVKCKLDPRGSGFRVHSRLRVSRKRTAEELDSSYSWTVASARAARQQLPSKTLSLYPECS